MRKEKFYFNGVKKRFVFTNRLFFFLFFVLGITFNYAFPKNVSDSIITEPQKKIVHIVGDVFIVNNGAITNVKEFSKKEFAEKKAPIRKSFKKKNFQKNQNSFEQVKIAFKSTKNIQFCYNNDSGNLQQNKSLEKSILLIPSNITKFVLLFFVSTILLFFFFSIKNVFSENDVGFSKYYGQKHPIRPPPKSDYLYF